MSLRNLRFELLCCIFLYFWQNREVLRVDGKVWFDILFFGWGFAMRNCWVMKIFDSIDGLKKRVCGSLFVGDMWYFLSIIRIGIFDGIDMRDRLGLLRRI